MCKVEKSIDASRTTSMEFPSTRGSKYQSVQVMCAVLHDHPGFGCFCRYLLHDQTTKLSRLQHTFCWKYYRKISTATNKQSIMFMEIIIQWVDHVHTLLAIFFFIIFTAVLQRYRLTLCIYQTILSWKPTTGCFNSLRDQARKRSNTEMTLNRIRSLTWRHNQNFSNKYILAKLFTSFLLLPQPPTLA